MHKDNLISLVLAGFLLLGLLLAAKVVFLGGMVFLGIWVLIERLPFVKTIAATIPVVFDAAATVGAFYLLTTMGQKSMTLFLATVVCCICVSIYVARLHRARQLRLHPPVVG